MTEKNFFTYILQCSNGHLYTGITTDVQRRMEQHHTGKGAKYTRGRGPFKLVYCEAFGTKGEALGREAQIKKLTREKKLKLILERTDDGFNKEKRE